MPDSPGGAYFSFEKPPDKNFKGEAIEVSKAPEEPEELKTAEYGDLVDVQKEVAKIESQLDETVEVTNVDNPEPANVVKMNIEKPAEETTAIKVNVSEVPKESAETIPNPEREAPELLVEKPKDEAVINSPEQVESPEVKVAIKDMSVAAPEAPAPEIITQVEVKPETPAVETGKEAIRERCGEAGQKILDGWRAYVAKINSPGDLEKMVIELNDDLDIILKSEGDAGKDFNFYDAVFNVLKNIENKLLITDKIKDDSRYDMAGNDNAGNTAEKIESQKDVEDTIGLSLKDLPKVGEDYRGHLRLFLERMGEALDNRELKKYPDRDELGKMIIELTKKEEDSQGGIPDYGILKPEFENNFGETLKNLGLFDLGVLIVRNGIIRDAAKIRNIESIVQLTDAFDKFLNTMKEAKEKKTQEFLTKKLEQMAA